MLANNAITILLIVFSFATVSAVVMSAYIFVPPVIDRRRQREIARLSAGAELLADAIGRAQGDAAHLARLTSNYLAHTRALAQLGQPIPPVPTAPAFANAA